MIKKKVKARRKKKINPYLQFQAENILNELDPKNKIDFKFIGEGSYGETYLFKLDQNKLFQNTILKPGKYILKVFKECKEEDIELPSSSEIKYLTKLSKYGLIPEIYIMTKEFNIMKYIEGVDFCDYSDFFFKKNIPPNIDRIVNNIEKLIQTWHKLGFAHGDLACSNILISKNNRVFFIDPYFEKRQSFNEDLYWLRQYKSLLD